MRIIDLPVQKVCAVSCPMVCDLNNTIDILEDDIEQKIADIEAASRTNAPYDYATAFAEIAELNKQLAEKNDLLQKIGATCVGKPQSADVYLGNGTNQGVSLCTSPVAYEEYHSVIHVITRVNE